MNFNIIAHCDVDECRPLFDEYILQIKQDTVKIANFYAKKYYVLNVKRKERFEVLPTIAKFDFISISDLRPDSKELYFITCKWVMGDNLYYYDLIRYSIVSSNHEIIYEYVDHGEMLKDNTAIKVFVLDEGYFLFQREIIRDDKLVSIDTFIYDIDKKSMSPISDNEILANGIENFIPIFDNKCLLKSGYSYFVDDRFDWVSGNDRNYEQLAIININQFVSELVIGKKNTCNLILEPSNRNVTLPYIFKGHDYFIYSKIDKIDHVENIVYYKPATKDIKIYTRKEIYRPSDLNYPCIIGGQMFLLKEIEDGYVFYDAENMEKEFVLKDVKLKAIENGYMIVEKVIPFGFFKRDTTFIEIYDYPGTEPVYSEKGYFVDAVSNTSNDLYIFTRG